MSEQEPVGNAWGDNISDERKVELEQRLQAWEQEADHGEREGPFDKGSGMPDVRLTGADVFWLAARRLATTSEPYSAAEQMELLQIGREELLVWMGIIPSTLNFSGADLRGANLSRAYVNGANLSRADLREANLSRADLRGANLSRAYVNDANLSRADLRNVNFSGADLRNARLNVETSLSEATISPSTLLADVIWNGAPLARVNWETLPVVADEIQARERLGATRLKKSAEDRLTEYEAAVRAYRLLAVALRDQGLNEHADRYAYRAQLMQRVVLRRQAFLRVEGKRVGLVQRLRKFVAYLGSGLLDLIAGYGYRPGRSIVTYVATIAVFAVLYWCVTNDVSLTHGLFTEAITWLGMTPPPSSQSLQGYEAVVVSMTSFHGRGFFQPVQTPGDKVAILASIEAAIGLLLEITFIATFTNRFFAR